MVQILHFQIFIWCAYRSNWISCFNCEFWVL